MGDFVGIVKGIQEDEAILNSMIFLALGRGPLAQLL